jgi:hypothetical protein
MRGSRFISPVVLIMVFFSVFLSCDETPDKGLNNRTGFSESPAQKVPIPSDYMSIRQNLQRTVTELSHTIGSRGYLELGSLRKTADFISSEFISYGYTASYQSYDVQGNTYHNIFTEIRGGKTPEATIIIGAHYDTVMGTPGADDNASGIAVLLELSRLMRTGSFDRTVQFVAFTLEEPPFFRTKDMGSYRYALKLSEEKKEVEGMICLESIGYFTDKQGSQLFPLPFFRWFFPDRGNFITFVSDLRSREFLRRSLKAFKTGSNLPVESLSTLSVVPGVDFSDHRSFWKFGYRAVMVTDTAFYRNPNYHGRGDTHETLDYERMIQVVGGLRSAIEALATD